MDRQGRKSLRQRCSRLMQKLPRNIDRYIGRGRQRIQEQRSFDRRAGAQLDQCPTNASDPGNLGRMVQKDVVFGPSEIVLGQLGDGLEEFRAAAIVEPTRRERSRPSAETSKDLRPEQVLIGRRYSF